MSDIAVAISTTGDRHRLLLLATTVVRWRDALLERSDSPSLFVTVDGDINAVDRVVDAIGFEPVPIYQVGQPAPMRSGDYEISPLLREGRLGVATNKNTGIELMMAETEAEHLFLSDDDIWPLQADALDLHVSGNLDHSMVCWGQHRFIEIAQDHQCASWNWPRGSMLYTRRSVVEKVGGMIEAFGPGGHEHVEWSRRIHQAGLTPVLFGSPYVYATDRKMAANNYWYAEDMPKRGEGMAGYKIRKDRTTSVRRLPTDWVTIDAIMAQRDGNTDFVPYSAGENGRASATLYHNRRA